MAADTQASGIRPPDNRPPAMSGPAPANAPAVPVQERRAERVPRIPRRAPEAAVPTAVPVALPVNLPPELVQVKPPPARRDPNTKLLVPSWSISVAVHATVVTILLLALPDFEIGAVQNPNDQVGIIFAEAQPQGEPLYFGEDEVLLESSAPSPTVSTQQQVANLFSETPATDPGASLPSENPAALGPGPQGGGSSVGDAGGMTGGGSGPKKNPRGGKAYTSVFGVEGEGTSFVYVFDRSLSMARPGQITPLDAAKTELLASLESLAETHRFQIIFYNHAPYVFNPAGTGRLAFADERTKEQARRFVYGVTADGSTNHELAIKKALELNADCIFFLTDADDGLPAHKLEEIRRRNGGNAAIHCIEFGIGPPSGSSRFLPALAAQNGGKYAYRDVTQFRGGQ